MAENFFLTKNCATFIAMKKFLPAFPILVLLGISILIFTTANFSGETKFSEIKSNTFSISLADYLSPTTGISKDAVLQYKHKEDKPVFFIVIAESKDTMTKYEKKYTLDKYFNETADWLKTRLSAGTLAKYYPDTINGNPAFIGVIRGKGQNSGLHYCLAVIETKKNFYQLLTGCDFDLKNRFEEDMLKEIKSFREN